MRKVICCIVFLAVILTGCAYEYSIYSMSDSELEEWISTLDCEEKLLYNYSYPTYSWNSSKKNYSIPDGYIIRFTGKKNLCSFDIYVHTYTYPTMTEDAFIMLYCSTAIGYEWYVDFGTIDYDYEYVEHMSDLWYSYIGDNGVCTSNLE